MQPGPCVMDSTILEGAAYATMFAPPRPVVAVVVGKVVDRRWKPQTRPRGLAATALTMTVLGRRATWALRACARASVQVLSAHQAETARENGEGWGGDGRRGRPARLRAPHDRRAAQGGPSLGAAG